jgi:hypothetical protein
VLQHAQQRQRTRQQRALTVPSSSAEAAAGLFKRCCAVV